MKRWLIVIGAIVAVGLVAAAPQYLNRGVDARAVGDHQQGHEGASPPKQQEPQQHESGTSKETETGSQAAKAAGDAQKPKGACGNGAKASGGCWIDKAAELNLTPDQKEKILTILQGKAERIQALKEAATQGDKAALKETIRQIRNESKQQIRAVLTPEQQAKLDEMLKKRKEAQAAKRTKRSFMGWLRGLAL